MSILQPGIPELAVCLFGVETILQKWISATEVDMNAENGHEFSLLCPAIHGQSSHAIIDLLLDNGADVNASGRSL